MDCYEIEKHLLKRKAPVILPSVYRCSQSHRDFLGTLSIRPETTIRIISMMSPVFLSLLATINILNTATTERNEEVQNIDNILSLVYI